MRRLAMALLLLVSCDKEPVPTIALPSAASSGARETHAEDFKLYLKPAVEDAAVLAHLKAAAAHVGAALDPATGPTKCRGVVFLDAQQVLRKRALSLRLRQQLDGDCTKRSERLAISFNLTTSTEAEAVAHRAEMGLAEGLGERNTKARYKLRHVLQEPRVSDLWVLGGTIRRLAKAPSLVSDLQTMFPHVKGLEAHASEALSPVAGKSLFEKNRDIARLDLGAVVAQVELATIFAADANAPGAPLARELSIELPTCCDARASTFAEHLRRAFGNDLANIERREDLVYP